MNSLTLDFKNMDIYNDYNPYCNSITKQIYYKQNLFLFVLIPFQTLRVYIQPNKENTEKNQIIAI